MASLSHELKFVHVEIMQEHTTCRDQVSVAMYVTLRMVWCYHARMEQTKKKAVVVGGAGFIGSHITDALIEKGYEVHVIDNLSGGKRENVNSAATLHVLDIRNLSDISPVIAKADYVFHLAALPRVQYSIDEPLLTHEVNTTGLLNVLVAAQKGGVGRVVYSGSSSAYGEQPVLPQHEDMREKPVHPYGLQKYVGEEYARIFFDIYQLPTATLRYFNVYGPRMDPDGPYAAVIGKFLKFRQEGKPLSIVGDGEQTRDFTHVADVVRANILAAESPKVGHGESINIGGGRNISINRLASLVGGERVHISARQEAKNSLADIGKAKKLLGWEPNVRVERGIADLLEEWGFECICKDDVCECALAEA